MLSYLNRVVAACAVYKELSVNIDGDVVYLHPAFAFSIAAAPVVGAVTYTSACVLAGKEDNIARLKLRWVGKQNAHILTLLRHRSGV